MKFLILLVAALGLTLTFLMYTATSGNAATPKASWRMTEEVLTTKVELHTARTAAFAKWNGQGDLESYVLYTFDNSSTMDEFSWDLRYDWEGAAASEDFAVTEANLIKHFRPLECLSDSGLVLADEWLRPEVQRAFELVQRARAEHRWWMRYANDLDEHDLALDIDLVTDRSFQATDASKTTNLVYGEIGFEAERLATLIGALAELEEWRMLEKSDTYINPCESTQ